MTRIPIHDDTVPIVCTVRRELIPSRIGMLERMRSDLRSVDRTEHGVLLHFPADPAIAALVRQFAVEEKDCCRFWGFEVHETSDGTTLRWDGPPSVTDVLDELMAFFGSDRPLTAFSALL